MSPNESLLTTLTGDNEVSSAPNPFPERGAASTLAELCGGVVVAKLLMRTAILHAARTCQLAEGVIRSVCPCTLFSPFVPCR